MPAAKGRSRPPAKGAARPSTKASGAAKTTKAGTSATTTKTGRSTRAPSTSAATAAPPAGGAPAGSDLDFDLGSAGGHILSVFGAFNSRALVEVPMSVVPRLFSDGVALASRTAAVEAIDHDIAAIRERDEDLADSALAAAAMSMAYELENPYNSATSKSMCARALLELMNRLRELAPPAEQGDGVDDIATQRAKRLGRSAAS